MQARLVEQAHLQQLGINPEYGVLARLTRLKKIGEDSGMQAEGSQGKALARFKKFCGKAFRKHFCFVNLCNQVHYGTFLLSKLLLFKNILSVANHSPMTVSEPRLRVEEQRQFEPILLS